MKMMNLASIEMINWEGKLQQAMLEFNDWLCKLIKIWKNKTDILTVTSKFIAGKSKQNQRKRLWQSKICLIWKCCLFPTESNQSDNNILIFSTFSYFHLALLI